MPSWQETLTGIDRVRAHTAESVLDDIDTRLRARLVGFLEADDDAMTRRLEELDQEWDIERVLIVNASTLAGLGVAAGAVRRPLLVLPLAVMGFLLQHGLQGWCPPLAVFRRRGVRTRREIDLERYAAKVLRGDFGPPASRDVDAILEQALRR